MQYPSYEEMAEMVNNDRESKTISDATASRASNSGTQDISVLLTSLFSVHVGLEYGNIVGIVGAALLVASLAILLVSFLLSDFVLDAQITHVQGGKAVNRIALLCCEHVAKAYVALCVAGLVCAFVGSFLP